MYLYCPIALLSIISYFDDINSIDPKIKIDFPNSNYLFFSYTYRFVPFCIAIKINHIFVFMFLDLYYQYN